MPSIGPAIDKVHRDCYGAGFTDAATPPWNDVWPARTPEDWRGLRDTYGVEYVLSPNTVPLRIRPIISGAIDTLYRIE